METPSVVQPMTALGCCKQFNVEKGHFGVCVGEFPCYLISLSPVQQSRDFSFSLPCVLCDRISEGSGYMFMIHFIMLLLPSLNHLHSPTFPSRLRGTQRGNVDMFPYPIPREGSTLKQ